MANYESSVQFKTCLKLLIEANELEVESEEFKSLLVKEIYFLLEHVKTSKQRTLAYLGQPKQIQNAFIVLASTYIYHYLTDSKQANRPQIYPCLDTLVSLVVEHLQAADTSEIILFCKVLKQLMHGASGVTLSDLANLKSSVEQKCGIDISEWPKSPPIPTSAPGESKPIDFVIEICASLDDLVNKKDAQLSPVDVAPESDPTCGQQHQQTSLMSQLEYADGVDSEFVSMINEYCQRSYHRYGGPEKLVHIMDALSVCGDVLVVCPSLLSGGVVELVGLAKLTLTSSKLSSYLEEMRVMAALLSVRDFDTLPRPQLPLLIKAVCCLALSFLLRTLHRHQGATAAQDSSATSVTGPGAQQLSSPSLDDGGDMMAVKLLKQIATGVREALTGGRIPYWYGQAVDYLLANTILSGLARIQQQNAEALASEEHQIQQQRYLTTSRAVGQLFKLGLDSLLRLVGRVHKEWERRPQSPSPSPPPGVEPTSPQLPQFSLNELDELSASDLLQLLLGAGSFHIFPDWLIMLANSIDKAVQATTELTGQQQQQAHPQLHQQLSVEPRRLDVGESPAEESTDEEDSSAELASLGLDMLFSESRGSSRGGTPGVGNRVLRQDVGGSSKIMRSLSVPPTASGKVKGQNQELRPAGSGSLGGHRISLLINLTELVEELLAAVTTLVRTQIDFVRVIIKTQFGDHSVRLFGALIKKMDDHRTATDQVEFAEVNRRFSSLIHHLLTEGFISHIHDSIILTQLGLATSDLAGSNTWPMTVPERALAYLADSVLVRLKEAALNPGDRQQQTSSGVEQLINNIWTRFLDSLASKLDQPTADSEDDINPTHLQLIVFLFNFLPCLTAKKQVLGRLAAIVASLPCQRQQPSLLLCRLLLIIKYQLHHFYDPPRILSGQVRHNLFTRWFQQQQGPQPAESAGPTASTEMYGSSGLAVCHYARIKEGAKSRRYPIFYDLMLVPNDGSQGPGTAMEDGLALSVLISRPDYPQFLSNVIRLMTDLLTAQPHHNQPTQQALAWRLSIRLYTFQISWRILTVLPPSWQLLDALEGVADDSGLTDASKVLTPGAVVYSLILGARLTLPGPQQQILELLPKSPSAPPASIPSDDSSTTSTVLDRVTRLRTDKLSVPSIAALILAQLDNLERHLDVNDEVGKTGAADLGFETLVYWDALVSYLTRLLVDKPVPPKVTTTTSADPPAASANESEPPGPILATIAIPLFTRVVSLLTQLSRRLHRLLDITSGVATHLVQLCPIRLARLSVGSGSGSLDRLSASLVEAIAPGGPPVLVQALEQWDAVGSIDTQQQGVSTTAAASSTEQDQKESRVDIAGHLRSNIQDRYQVAVDALASNTTATPTPIDQSTNRLLLQQTRRLMFSLSALANQLVPRLQQQRQSGALPNTAALRSDLLALHMNLLVRRAEVDLTPALEMVLGCSLESGDARAVCEAYVIERVAKLLVLMRDGEAVKAAEGKEESGNTKQPKEETVNRLDNVRFECVTYLEWALAQPLPTLANMMDVLCADRDAGQGKGRSLLHQLFLCLAETEPSVGYKRRLLKFFCLILLRAHSNRQYTRLASAALAGLNPQEEQTSDPSELGHFRLWLSSLLYQDTAAHSHKSSNLFDYLNLFARLVAGSWTQDEELKSKICLTLLTELLCIHTSVVDWTNQLISHLTSLDDQPEEAAGKSEKSAVPIPHPLTGLPQLVGMMVSLAEGCKGATGHTALVQPTLEWANLFASGLLRAHHAEGVKERVGPDLWPALASVAASLRCLYQYLASLICALNPVYPVPAGDNATSGAANSQSRSLYYLTNHQALAALGGDVELIDRLLLSAPAHFQQLDASAVDGDKLQVGPYSMAKVAAAAKDDSDEEEDADEDYDNLDDQLCTYSATQKEFVDQHWYNCHTCNMVESEGVCTVCAKVCHAGHDLSYAKRGSFFCDCGEAGEGRCKALVRRVTTASTGSTGIGGASGSSSTGYRRAGPAMGGRTASGPACGSMEGKSAGLVASGGVSRRKSGPNGVSSAGAGASSGAHVSGSASAAASNGGLQRTGGIRRKIGVVTSGVGSSTSAAAVAAAVASSTTGSSRAAGAGRKGTGWKPSGAPSVKKPSSSGSAGASKSKTASDRTLSEAVMRQQIKKQSDGEDSGGLRGLIALHGAGLIAHMRSKLAEDRETLSILLSTSSLLVDTMELIGQLEPVLTSYYHSVATGGLQRLREAFQRFLVEPKSTQMCSDIVTGILDSQEGVLDPTGIPVSGVQVVGSANAAGAGTTGTGTASANAATTGESGGGTAGSGAPSGGQIRALIQASQLRRNVLALLTMGAGGNTLAGADGGGRRRRRHYLVVTQEKCKLTILHISPVLKQASLAARDVDRTADGNAASFATGSNGAAVTGSGAKPSVQLKRVCTTSTGFHVLTMAANRANEELLAVCGVKECLVLTLTPFGSVASRVSVTPLLEESNEYIVRPCWLPGSSSQLAIVTSHSVQVFDLTRDTRKPLYYFKPVEGRFRDVTFVRVPMAKRSASASVGDGCEGGTAAEDDEAGEKCYRQTHASADNGPCYILVMSQMGSVLFQKLGPDCLANLGPFYLAESLEWSPETFNLERDPKTQSLGQGGVSVHYSHTMQLFMHTYQSGHTFCTVLDPTEEKLTVGQTFQLETKKAGGGTNGASSSSPAFVNGPLYNWSEVEGHPGLFTAVSQPTNNPVLVAVEPNRFLVQEISVAGPQSPTAAAGGAAGVTTPVAGGRSRIVDSVTLRWTPASSGVGSGARTMTTVLTADGRIVVYVSKARDISLSPTATLDNGTGAYDPQVSALPGQYWLQSRFTSMAPRLGADRALISRSGILFPHCGTGIAAGGQADAGRSRTRPKGFDRLLVESPQEGKVPVDFFEHCSPTNDVSFGGADLLQLYNREQLKRRLTATDSPVACARPGGFTIEIKNEKPQEQVIVGVRVGVNVTESDRLPQFFSVFGRRIEVPRNVPRSRSFDIPFYRREIVKTTSKVELTVGRSSDSHHISIIDWIRVYVRSRESLGLPPIRSATSSSALLSGTAAGKTAGGTSGEQMSGGSPGQSCGPTLTVAAAASQLDHLLLSTTTDNHVTGSHLIITSPAGSCGSSAVPGPELAAAALQLLTAYLHLVNGTSPATEDQSTVQACQTTLLVHVQSLLTSPTPPLLASQAAVLLACLLHLEKSTSGTIEGGRFHGQLAKCLLDRARQQLDKVASSTANDLDSGILQDGLTLLVTVLRSYLTHPGPPSSGAQQQQPEPADLISGSAPLPQSAPQLVHLVMTALSRAVAMEPMGEVPGPLCWPQVRDLIPGLVRAVVEVIHAFLLAHLNREEATATSDDTEEQEKFKTALLDDCVSLLVHPHMLVSQSARDALINLTQIWCAPPPRAGSVGPDALLQATAAKMRKSLKMTDNESQQGPATRTSEAADESGKLEGAVKKKRRRRGDVDQESGQGTSSAGSAAGVARGQLVSPAVAQQGQRSSAEEPFIYVFELAHELLDPASEYPEDEDAMLVGGAGNHGQQDPDAIQFEQDEPAAAAAAVAEDANNQNLLEEEEMEIVEGEEQDMEEEEDDEEEEDEEEEDADSVAIGNEAALLLEQLQAGGPDGNAALQAFLENVDDQALIDIALQLSLRDQGGPGQQQEQGQQQQQEEGGAGPGSAGGQQQHAAEGGANVNVTPAAAASPPAVGPARASNEDDDEVAMLAQLAATVERHRTGAGPGTGGGSPPSQQNDQSAGEGRDAAQPAATNSGEATAGGAGAVPSLALTAALPPRAVDPIEQLILIESDEEDDEDGSSSDSSDTSAAASGEALSTAGTVTEAPNTRGHSRSTSSSSSSSGGSGARRVSQSEAATSDTKQQGVSEEQQAPPAVPPHQSEGSIIQSAAAVVLGISAGQESSPNVGLSGIPSPPPPSPGSHAEGGLDPRQRLGRALRLALIGRLTQRWSDQLGKVDGPRAVPFLQLVYTLARELDVARHDEERVAFRSVLTAALTYLDIKQRKLDTLVDRSPSAEVALLHLRLLATLLQPADGSAMTQQQASAANAVAGGTKSSQQLAQGREWDSGSRGGVIITLETLIQEGGPQFCLNLVDQLHERWQHRSNDEDSASSTAATNAPTTSTNPASPSNTAIKPALVHPLHDWSPFFLRQYVFEHLHDVFDDFLALVTEAALRLPYTMLKCISQHQQQQQVNTATTSGSKHRKIAGDIGPFRDERWGGILCEFIEVVDSSHLKKQIRKLLMQVVGSKHYRQLRDIHLIGRTMQRMRSVCAQYGLSVRPIAAAVAADTSSGVAAGAAGRLPPFDDLTSKVNIPYMTMCEMIESIKVCNSVASARTANWQRYCLKCPDVLVFLMRAVLSLDSYIGEQMFQLLQAALCPPPPIPATSASGAGSTAAGTGQTEAQPTASSHRHPHHHSHNRQQPDKGKESAETKTQQPGAERPASSRHNTADGGGSSTSDLSSTEAKLCSSLAKLLDPRVLLQFIRVFLCRAVSMQTRWATEAIIYELYRHSDSGFQVGLLDHLWELWPELSSFSRKAGQYLDLFGFLLLEHPEWPRRTEFMATLVATVGLRTDQIANHPNGSLYTAIRHWIDPEGYYLELEPCIACHEMEPAFTNYKWDSEPTDSRRLQQQQAAAAVAGTSAASGGANAAANMAAMVVGALPGGFIHPHTRSNPYMHLFKFKNSFTIASFTIKFNHLAKRTRFVRTLNIYYSNQGAKAASRMLNQADLWIKAKRINLAKDQSEVHIDFPVPLTAAYLMVEYADFYPPSPGEKRICPRCHTSNIQGNTCLQCKDNINQCFRCRSINFSAADIYLCSNCNSCRYGKIEFTISAKPSYASIEPVASEDDRSVELERIAKWTENLEKKVRSLVALRQRLELVLDHSADVDAAESLVRGLGGGAEQTAATAALAHPLATTAADAAAAAENAGSLTGHQLQQLLRGEEVMLTRAAAAAAGRHRQQQQQLQSATTAAASSGTPAAAADSAQSASGTAASTQQQQTGVPASFHRDLHHLLERYVGEAKPLFLEINFLAQQVWSARQAVTEYDRAQRQVSVQLGRSDSCAPAAIIATWGGGRSTLTSSAHGKAAGCFGCAVSTLTRCVWLLNGLAVSPLYRAEMGNGPLITDLVERCMPRCSTQLAREMRLLVCAMTRDSPAQVKKLNSMIVERVTRLVVTQAYNPHLDRLLHTEMELLRGSVSIADQCWEERLRPVMLLLVELQASPTEPTTGAHTAPVLKSVLLPCYRLLQAVMRPPLAAVVPLANLTKKHTTTINPTHLSAAGRLGLPTAAAVTAVPPASVTTTSGAERNSAYVRLHPNRVSVNLPNWLNGVESASFKTWLTAMPKARSRRTAIRRQVQHAVTTATAGPQQQRQPASDRASVRERYLQEKYWWRWLERMEERCRRRCQQQQQQSQSTPTSPPPIADVTSSSLTISPARSWLREALFTQTSRPSRQTAAALLESLAASCPERHTTVVLFLVSCLPYLADAAPCGPASAAAAATEGSDPGADFVALFKRLTEPDPWRYFLVLKCNFLDHLDNLMLRVLDRLTALENRTVHHWSENLGQSALGTLEGSNPGHVLHYLSELVFFLVEREEIGKKYRCQLVRSLLHACLNLRRLVLQRTKVTMEMESKFLDLVDRLSNDSDEHIRDFLKIAVEVLAEYPISDQQSACYMIDRMCSYICPRDFQHPLFNVLLEVWRGQEDYLLSRMTGIPLRSDTRGLGPRIRDVLLFICSENNLTTDVRLEIVCENQIMMPELLLEDVYEQIWLANPNNRSKPMRLQYRISGLDEDNLTYVQELSRPVPLEQYRRAEPLAHHPHGLAAILIRLGSVKEVVRGRPLMRACLRLLDYCLKTEVNREKLVDPQLRTVPIMVHALTVCLEAAGVESSRIPELHDDVTVPLLRILETVLQMAGQVTNEEAREQLRLQMGDVELADHLLARITTQPSLDVISGGVTHIVSLLTFGVEAKIEAIIDFLEPHLKLLRADAQFNEREMDLMTCCCALVRSVPADSNGAVMRDRLVERGILDVCIKYVMDTIPTGALDMATADSLDMSSPDLRRFLDQKSLPFVLQIMRGCAGQKGHRAVGDRLLATSGLLPFLHRLETVKSIETIGVLAEDLMNDLAGCGAEVEATVNQLRHRTSHQIHSKARTMRDRQLKKLNMVLNEKGQVKLKEPHFIAKMAVDVMEEPGLTCAVCHDGFRNAPREPLGIYTFARRCPVEELDARENWVHGYTTVTSFILIHYSCHQTAIKESAENEWVVARRHNQDAKCNNLLPVCGHNQPENAYSNNLSRYIGTLRSSLNLPDISYQTSLHDIKLLLLRFAHNRPFNEDTGGGARSSNLKLIPHLMQVALHTITVSLSADRELESLNTFLNVDPAKEPQRWLSSAWETNGPLYRTVIALHLWPHATWARHRLTLLKRLLLLGHARHTLNPGQTSLPTQAPRKAEEFPAYKPYCIFWAMIDAFYKHLFKSVKLEASPSEDQPASGASAAPVTLTWPQALCSYIRTNEVDLLEATNPVLNCYEQDLLPSESFAEFCDVAGLLGDIAQPDSFIEEVLNSLGAPATAPTSA